MTLPSDTAALLAQAHAALLQGDRDAGRRLLDGVVPPDDAEMLVTLGILKRELGDHDEARGLFEKALRRDPKHMRAWQKLGGIHRDFGAFDEAAAAFDRALILAPGNKDLLNARARVESERGGAALEFYERAYAASPDDPDIALGRASAKFEAGDGAGALADLRALTAKRPDWLKGHAALAQLRWQLGDSASFTQGFDDAIARDPKNIALWTEYFDALARATRYADILQNVDRARAIFGAAIFLDRFESVAATETNDIHRADQAFARLDWRSDTSLQVGYMRHLLRAGRAAEAATLGETLVAKADGAGGWPYLATAWRLLGDPRWQWLEGAPQAVAITDIDVDLPALATVLRRLHTARKEPFGQTLRHGTQTQGALLNRREPEIVNLRTALEGAIRGYIARLPAPDPRHPLLRAPRDELGFTGSWSVRLTDAGYHTNHTHPQGWISSAFYVVLPQSVGQDEGNPAGWLALGQPPVELGLNLAPTRLIAPKPGRLVLFPSTMWHGTIPFGAGERLTVAFDVKSR